MKTIKKTHKLVMLPIEKANSDSKSIIFKQTRNVFGSIIPNAKLEITTNKTFIRNIVLQSEKKLAGNDASDYEFYHIYILSDDKIQSNDWFITSGCILRKCKEVVKSQSKLFDVVIDTTGGEHHESVNKKIIASTDNEITPSSWINDSFVNAYNDNIHVTEVDLEYHPEYEDWSEEGGAFTVHAKIKTREDGSVIIHKVKSLSKEEMYLNMQYYMEYCQQNGYVTPQNWIEKHKHF